MPPPELVRETLAYGVLLPAAVSFGLLALARRFAEHDGDLLPRLLGALALAGGFFAAHVALGGAPLAPARPWDWLPALAALAGAAGLVDAAPRVPPGLRWGVRVVVAALAARLLVPALPELDPARPWWLGAVGGAVLALWSLLDPPAGHWPGAGLPLLLALAAAAGGAVLEFSGNLLLAQLAGALAAVLVGGALASWGSGRPLTHGLVPGVAVLLPGLMLEGYFYNSSEVPLVSFALVIAAPLALGVLAAPPLRKAEGRWRVLAPAAALLVPLGLAVALAAAA